MLFKVDQPLPLSVKSQMNSGSVFIQVLFEFKICHLVPVIQQVDSRIISITNCLQISLLSFHMQGQQLPHAQDNIKS